MAKRVTYADAVELLGGDSKLIKALDNALGVALFAGGPLTLSLFDAKTEAIRLANQLLGSLREKLGKLPRATRTERLVAAHEIIITTAFFEALDDLELPVSLEDLHLEEPAGESLISSVTQLRSTLVGRDPMTPTSLHLDELLQNYTLAAHRLAILIDRLHPRSISRDRWETLMTVLSGELPKAAVRRYQDLYHRLASDFPEFAF
ncbi:NACHT N-terminal helical domain 7-containing protein [Herbidospora sp. RD11066]